MYPVTKNGKFRTAKRFPIVKKIQSGIFIDTHSSNNRS